MKNEKLTAKERMEAEARLAAIKAEAKSLRKFLDEDKAAKVPEVAEKAPVEEAADEVAEVAEEAPVEEAADEVAEVAEEAPVEEAADEAAEVAEEAPVEEAADEVAEVAEEAPVEEAADEVAEVAEEAPVEEAADEVAEVAEEAPVEEAADEVAEVAEEAPVEEAADEVAEVAEEAPVNTEKENNETVGFAKFFKWIAGVVGVAALVGILVMLVLMYVGRGNQVPGGDPVDPDNGVVDPTPGGQPDVAFDIDAFVAATVNIAKTITTDEDVATNVDVFAEKIGADKLEELVGKYGELTVQKAIAEYIAFVPEIKMNQYISNKGLAYNPNAADDYYKMLDEKDKAYTEATGKNPNGALMSLEGYDTYKSNREAMKALIAESGDLALLTWYEAKTEGYDVMVEQNSDTETALAYKEEVKLELVNNVNGSVKLLELQLEQKVNGTNADTLKYTDVYAEFIINNYMYVVAN